MLAITNSFFHWSMANQHQSTLPFQLDTLSFTSSPALPRNWSMCFHPFVTVPNRMEMQVPKLPKAGVAGDFPQPMAVLPGMNSGWKHPRNTEFGRKPMEFYGFMDFLVFLFACDKWPWSMIKNRLDMIIRSRLGCLRPIWTESLLC